VTDSATADGHAQNALATVSELDPDLALSSAESDDSGTPESPAYPAISALESELGYPVVVYRATAASMEQIDIGPMHRLLEQSGKQQQLGLILQSSGGDPDAAHILASTLHEYTDHLHIFVPTWAYSAATLLALSADTLWMGPSSELSPIDPQVALDPGLVIPSPRPMENVTGGRPVFMPAHIIRDFLELSGVTHSKGKSPVDTQRLRHLIEPLLNPWVLGWYERTDKVSRFYAKEALLTYLLKNESDADALADKIISTLLDEYASHEAGILRGPARRMGIPVSDIPDSAWKHFQALGEIYDSLPSGVTRLIETKDGFEARTREARECGGCKESTEVRPGFVFCPKCGTPFERQCLKCGGAMNPDWDYCARCGTSADAASADKDS
jgi:hypothetical protein